MLYLLSINNKLNAKLIKSIAKKRDLASKSRVRVGTHVGYGMAEANHSELVARQLLVLGPPPLFIIKRLHLYS
jgi:hypothetical protein